MKHVIVVRGVWFNDGSAGVELRCTTCKLVLLSDDDDLPMAAVILAAGSHAQGRG